jgi:KDO2-lipid IV(A) lauroyltransferase
VRDSFDNIGRSAAEFVRLDKIKPLLKEIIPIEGKENLDRALSLGRGVLLMTGHIDNWEMAGARLVLEGYPIVPVYTPQPNDGGINDFIQRQRTEAAGMRMVPNSGGGMRDIIRALKANRVVCILQDLDARKRGISVPFFGLPASAYDGIVKLSCQYGSPVVPVFYSRLDDKIHHRMVFLPALNGMTDEDGNPFGSDMEKSLRMCNGVLEDWIRERPGQWLWLLDRWGSTLK